MKPLRSELRFASYLAYSPRGTEPLHVRSRDLVRQIKENRVVRDGESHTPIAALVARRLRQTSPPFVHDFLGTERWLVPVPRSGLRKPGALWPALELAQALAAEGFGAGVVEALERVKAVPKAATANAAERPKAETHFESLALADPLALPSQITLVDDVITRGAQVIGAAWRIESVRPDVDVCAFAVVRTLSNPDDFTAIGAACSGVVRLKDGVPRRRP